MAKKNNALTVFAQVVSNRSANTSDNPTLTSCWGNFADHVDWLFDTDGFGSTDTTQNLAGTAIMNLKTDTSVTIEFPASSAGGGEVVAADFAWIAAVIKALYDAHVWVEPKENKISYNSLQSISFNMFEKQNRDTETTNVAESTFTADDSKATYY